MTDRRKRTEYANAEILGVVLLIGIFAITAGIISATTFATPQPVKVPAASIEITRLSETTFRFAHAGGDPLPLASLSVLCTRADGSTEPRMAADWLEETDGTEVRNGFVGEGSNASYTAIAVTWQSPEGGASVLAKWDPSGILPFAPGGSIPGDVQLPGALSTVTPLPVLWSEEDALTAEFTLGDGSPVGVDEPFLIDDRSEEHSTGTITHWSWNFGDGRTHEGTSSGEPFPFSYGRAGTYSVTLTVSNPETGARDTTSHSITVEGPPTGDPLVDFTILPQDRGNRDLTVTCQADTSINATAWQWETFDSQNGTTTLIGPFYGNLMTDPSMTQVFEFSNHDPLFNNLCTVTLTVWSPYIADPVAVTKTLTVGGPLEASFTANVSEGFVPQPVQFLDTSTGMPDTRLWDFGDGTTDTTLNPEHVFTAAGTYTVTLTITGYDQTLPGTPPGSHVVTDTVSATIVIDGSVTANFTANVTFGELTGGQFPVAFTDLSTGGPTNWTWSFGDGATSHEQHPVHTYRSNGKWMVSLVAEKFDPDSADVMVKYIYIRVGPAVTANFTAAPTVVAAEKPVQFTDTSTSADPGTPINQWTWDFGDGTTSTEQNPSHSYAAPGTYNVTLSVENGYRVDTLTRMGYVTVLPPIVALFEADRTGGGAPLTVQFTDQSSESPTAWSWDFNGDGSAESTLQHPSYTYTDPGTYSVSLTASNAYDTDKETREEYIRVYGPVTASFNATPLGGLAPLSVRFTDTSTGGPTTWSWSFGDGTTSTEQSPTHVYTSPGNYTVTLTVANPYFSDIEVGAQPIRAIWPRIFASAGPNGSISPTGTVEVPSGGFQPFAITPATGYHVADVLVDNVAKGAIQAYLFENVTVNHAINASFAINTYTITWTSNKGKGDSITPGTPCTVNHGGNVSFTATANKWIEAVTIDGISQTVSGKPKTYTVPFTNVVGNHTFDVTFK